MRIRTDNREPKKKVRLEMMALVASLCLGSVWAIVAAPAFAAPPAPEQPSPAPAWKMLAATGPTHLPSKQSESQRITIEAEGGTFTLSHISSEGTGTLNFAVSEFAEANAGSNEVLVVPEEGTYEVGQLVSGAGIPAGTTIIGISGPASEPLLELSNNATETGFPQIKAFGKKITGVTTTLGAFGVGDEIIGNNVALGTTVTGVSGSTLTLSEYVTGGGTVSLIGRAPTPPLPYNAATSTIQGALAALPGFGAGSVTVTGGPGGSASTPYFVTFGGSLAGTDIDQLHVNGNALLGAHPHAAVFTTVPGGPGTGKIAVAPTNIGGGATSGVITVRLGPLPEGIVTAGPVEEPQEPTSPVWNCPGGAGEKTVVCTSTTVVPRLHPAEGFVVPVKVDQLTASSAPVAVMIEGGNGGSASFQVPIVVSNQPASFGVQAFWAGAFNAAGIPEAQAGGHPYSAQAFFFLNTVRSASGGIVPVGDSKDVLVDLPPGFLGNPLVTQRCPQSILVSDLEGAPLCNNEMNVGVFDPALNVFGPPALSLTADIFNDVPAQGTAAQFTTIIASPQQSLVGSLRASGDGGIRVAAPNNPNINKIFGAYAAIEGEPPTAHGRAFLDNPTDCAQQNEELAQGRGPATGILASSWQAPSMFDQRFDTLPLLTECKLLTKAWVGNGPDPSHEEPSFSFEPTNTQGSSPTGATARLHIPQEGIANASTLVTAHLKKAVVTLPEGLTVNPSSANGLESCTLSQIGFLGGNFPSPTPIRFDERAAQCPDGSKLGTFEATTPALEEGIGGTIYLAAQEENPFHALIGLYLVVESPRFGLTLKLAGEVKPDPNHGGQLTATFDNNPQVPVEDLVLHFRGGDRRSELATPEVCGHYKTTGGLTPWSAEAGEAAQISEAGFSVGSNCASSPGAQPFSPSFEAGTTDPKAGAYSPLVIRIGRKDGEQELDQLNFTLPMGVVGKLAGIPYCSESAIAAASGKSGKAELANPSCPGASQVGTVDTSAGVGSEPIHVGGRVYLAGPYKGAPISTVVITPAVAGPFDLGTVVVRAPAFVNLETAQITVKSDPVPTMLRGLPLKLRSVVVNVDRPNFILNPTNCQQQTFAASLHGVNGATATPSNRFQVGGCEKLKFKPDLKLSLKGATKRSGHPALKAVVTYPKKGAYSNIARAQVGLPHSEFLDQGNLDKVCTQPELKSATCPKRAVYGHAKAWTPLLEKPLEGPVYIGVGYGHKLPDLVADLNGQVRILLHGKVDTTPHEGLRNTFEVVPDAPVSRFVLEMKGGKKYGLLENSENLCSKTQRASALFKAQNGLSLHLQPLIANECKKKSKRKSGGHHKKSGKKKGKS